MSECGVPKYAERLPAWGRSKSLRNVVLAFAWAIPMTLFAFRLFGQIGAALNSVWKQDYAGDDYFAVAAIRGLARGEWQPFGQIQSAQLGAPWGMNLSDFPASDSLHYLVIKAISAFSKDAIVLYNAYWLLGFPLAAATMAFALSRILGRRHFLVVPLALIYAFLPFHLNRYGHLFLAAYFMVPILLPVLFGIDRLNINPLHRPFRQLSLAFGLTLFASSGVYYAFFGAYLALVMGVKKALERRSWRPVANGFWVIALICAGVYLNVRPSFQYWRTHGKNPLVASREHWEADMYGFKLTPFLLPPDPYAIRKVGELRAHYEEGLHVTRGAHESAGVVTAIATLFVLAFLLFGRAHLARLGRPAVVSDAAVLFLAIFLLGTVGGLGSLFNTLVTPEIRAYERIYPFLCAFALIAAAAIWRKGPRRHWRVVLTVLILAAQFLEFPVTRRFGVPRQEESDRNFYRAIDRLVTAAHVPAPQILQIPYSPFPEGGHTERMGPYEHFAGVIFDPEIRWSHGVVHGRAGDDVLPRIASGSNVDLGELRKLGYTGLTVDRYGLKPDADRQLESDLRKKLRNGPAAESQDKRYAYYAF